MTNFDWEVDTPHKAAAALTLRRTQLSFPHFWSVTLRSPPCTPHLCPAVSREANPCGQRHLCSLEGWLPPCLTNERHKQERGGWEEKVWSISSPLSTGFGATVLARVVSFHYDTLSTLSGVWRKLFPLLTPSSLMVVMASRCCSPWMPDLHWLIQFFRVDV